jgi:hypothetical protein
MGEGQNISAMNAAKAKIGFQIPTTGETRISHAPGFNPVPYGIGKGSTPGAAAIPKTTLISADRGGRTEIQRELSNPGQITHGLFKDSRVLKH